MLSHIYSNVADSPAESRPCLPTAGTVCNLGQAVEVLMEILCHGIMSIAVVNKEYQDTVEMAC